VARVLCQIGGAGAAESRGAPQWMFLDEPTQSLDIAHQLAVLDVAQRHARAGGGALAILHDLNLASLYADRLIMLDRGRVVGDGDPAEVLTAPLLQSVFGERITVVTLGPDDRSYVVPTGVGGEGAKPAHP
jgi:iron complex transport system ATP-binding protein